MAEAGTPQPVTERRLTDTALLRSLFDAPLEPGTLRWAGELLLIGSAISWGALAAAMLVSQLGGASTLPVVESIVGTVMLLAAWRFYPRQLSASAPILLHAIVVYAFIAFVISYENAAPLADIWIVTWACCAASILTLGFGLLNALFLMISGTLALNLVFQWCHPGAPSPMLASVIGISAAAVVALITHCVCFQLTRASTATRQLQKLRLEMLAAFEDELSTPRAAVEEIAFRLDVNPRTSAALGLVNSQLNTLSELLRSQAGVQPHDAAGADVMSLEDVVTIATSMERRVCAREDIAVEMRGGTGDGRRLLMPGRIAVLVLSYLTREAVLRRTTQALEITSGILEDAEGRLRASVILRINVGEDSANSGRLRRADPQSQLTESSLRKLLGGVGGELRLARTGQHWRTAEVLFPVRVNELGSDSSAGGRDDQDTAFSEMDVLLIEDDELTRLLTARNLERRGARVDQVEDAASAVAALDERPFDLVIADLHLPDESGADMIARLRARNSTVPIVVATVANGAADLQELVAAGADQLLGKPLQNEHVQLSVALLRAAGRIPAPENDAPPADRDTAGGV